MYKYTLHTPNNEEVIPTLWDLYLSDRSLYIEPGDLVEGIRFDCNTHRDDIISHFNERHSNLSWYILEDRTVLYV